MLKPPDNLEELEASAEAALRKLLAEVPAIRLKEIERGLPAGADLPDLLAQILVAGHRHTLVCEFKQSGQPRIIRTALLQLRNYIAHSGKKMTPMVIDPYLSPETRELCREQQAAYLDLEGNARLALDNVFVERTVASKPPAEKRSLRSLFKPKAASILKALLREPPRPWRVTQLAVAARVSLGHVSAVRNSLINREWAQRTENGLVISQPGELLDSWRDAYEPPAGTRTGFYTTLHGAAFEKAVRTALRARPQPGRVIFASYTAGHWLAPYGRTGKQYFYADIAGLDRLRQTLELSSAAKGENVVVTIPKDDGLFLDTIEPSAGAVCTGVLQTYLDLSIAGERGREAADHLREKLLPWTK